MGEAKDVVAELLTILPDNDWLKAAIVVFALLLVVLKEKLFTGSREVSRYIFHWTKCQIFRKHTWKYYSFGDMVNFSGIVGPSNFVYKCVVCLKEEKRPAVPP